MQTTTPSTISLQRSIGPRHEITGDRSRNGVLNSSLYRHLLHEVNGLAVNFAELLMATQILSSFPLQNYWFRAGEMQI